MAGKINALSGTEDLYPPRIHLWHLLERAAREVFPSFGYEEIRVPVLERSELFVRSVGETSDIVEKEMFSFTTKGGDAVSLRPEGTAGVVRAFVQRGLAQSDPTARFWYLGPMYRYERPQKGRQREFWQLGAEAFGHRSARVDAELLAMLEALWVRAGLKGVELRLSSIGDARCRPPYRSELQAFLEKRRESLCEDCRRRIQTNPMRVLDCKNPACQEAVKDAPRLLDRLCEECDSHFKELRRNLELLHVSHQVDPRIVRGLDYYVRTSFELVHAGEALGSQNAVGGGGRYDGLVKELGGPDLPGIGFGLGMERLVMVLERQAGLPGGPALLFVVPLGETAADALMRVSQELRAQGVTVEIDYAAKPKGLGNSLDKANRRGARWALILGEEELARRVAKVKDLASGEQREVGLEAGAIRALLRAPVPGGKE